MTLAEVPQQNSAAAKHWCEEIIHERQPWLKKKPRCLWIFHIFLNSWFILIRSAPYLMWIMYHCHKYIWVIFHLPNYRLGKIKLFQTITLPLHVQLLLLGCIVLCAFHMYSTSTSKICKIPNITNNRGWFEKSMAPFSYSINSHVWINSTSDHSSDQCHHWTRKSPLPCFVLVPPRILWDKITTQHSHMETTYEGCFVIMTSSVEKHANNHDFFSFFIVSQTTPGNGHSPLVLIFLLNHVDPPLIAVTSS